MTCSSFQRIRKKIGNRMWVERFVSVRFFKSYSKKTKSFILTLKPNRILSRFLTKTSTEKIVIQMNEKNHFPPKLLKNNDSYGKKKATKKSQVF